MASRIPGRCTLTATCRPSRKRARWTWPSEAAAIGLTSKSRKGLRHANAELGGDDFLDFIETERLHFVLQPGERFQVGLRHQLDPGGKQLAELYKGGPKFLQVACQLVGFGCFLGRNALLGLERFFQSALLDEVGTAIFHEEPRDLAIAIEMLRFQRDGHASLNESGGPKREDLARRADGIASTNFQSCGLFSLSDRHERLLNVQLRVTPHTRLCGSPCRRLRANRKSVVFAGSRPCGFTFLDKPVALLGVVVGIGRLDFVAPALSLRPAFSFRRDCRAIPPFRASLAPFSTSALKSSPFTPLKPKSMLSSGQSKWYSPMLPADQRAAFVERAAKNGVAADPDPRTARRFLASDLFPTTCCS